jgi:anthranilate synthase component I
MFYNLNKEQFLKLAESGKYVAVYRELLADTITPITAFEALSDQSTRGILLESGLRSQTSGAYSFLGLDPYATFTSKNAITCITTSAKTETYEKQAPLSLLRQFHRRFHCVSDSQAKLAGQMMGFLSYDAVRYFEEIPDRHADTADFPDILFHFYQTNLVFNHELNKLLLAIVVEINQSPERIYAEAQKKLEQIIEKLQQTTPSIAAVPFAADSPSIDSETFHTDCDDEQFHRMVEQVKSYIHAGDAFQVVLSRTFYKPLRVAPLSAYRILRYSNPTPYMFYLTSPEFVILGASPEKLVSVENRVITIAPIAGTIPLNGDIPEEALAEALRNDDKERAEHMMLVDLARNDIGAICEPGSVHVSRLMQEQRLTHVMHLVSYVNGKLAEEYDAFDLLKATFPAGTLSGAPKIRAMEIIDELETSKRHIYGGAICKIDLAGNMDSCITIRTGVVKDGMIHIRAGGGIVFDSVPEKEAAETRHKAKGILQAIALAERGVA